MATALAFVIIGVMVFVILALVIILARTQSRLLGELNLIQQIDALTAENQRLSGILFKRDRASRRDWHGHGSEISRGQSQGAHNNAQE